MLLSLLLLSVALALCGALGALWALGLAATALYVATRWLALRRQKLPVDRTA